METTYIIVSIIVTLGLLLIGTYLTFKAVSNLYLFYARTKINISMVVILFLFLAAFILILVLFLINRDDPAILKNYTIVYFCVVWIGLIVFIISFYIATSVYFKKRIHHVSNFDNENFTKLVADFEKEVKGNKKIAKIIKEKGKKLMSLKEDIENFNIMLDRGDIDKKIAIENISFINYSYIGLFSINFNKLVLLYFLQGCEKIQNSK